MFSGPPLPLHNDLRLAELAALTKDWTGVGAWVQNGPRQALLHLTQTGQSRRPILISRDLGRLLRCCSRIVLRAGTRALMLKAEVLMQWRTLQVATATPYLPGVERLREQLPGLQILPGAGLVVPIQAWSPEAVLAELLTRGIEVSGSRVVYKV